MISQATQDILSKTLEIPESVDNRIEETLLRIKSDELKVDSKKGNSYKKPIYKRPVIFAAAVVMMIVMFSTIALAYSEGFREFVFGDFRLRIYESVEMQGAYFVETDDGFIVTTNPDDNFGHVDLNSFDNSPSVESFLSIEELQQSTSLIVREPSYLPDNVTFREVGVLLNGDGTFSNTVIIAYEYEYTMSHKMLFLSQMYIGADTLDLEVVERIEHHDFQSKTSFEAVMIGDIEALLAVTTIDGEVDDSISLSWSYDGFAYMISAIGFGIDTLIAIAKSI